jgi:hypothetical protein
MTEAESADVELFHRIFCTVTGLIFTVLASVTLIL